MIGKLTIDKASMNLSYFLYTIKIISSNNGSVSRSDFSVQMGKFIGQPSVNANGRENRTPFNKSKLPRYFGFVDVKIGSNSEQLLVLTHRGEILKKYIEDSGVDIESKNRFKIKEENRSDFINLIFESVIFDTFGKNNCGAEQSNTDIEPAKIVFKTIYELGSATAEEICFVIYGLNRGKNGINASPVSSFEEAIETIKANRANNIDDYSELIEQWKIENIVNDCKIINIFTDPNIDLLKSEKDENSKKIYYSLSDKLEAIHKKQIEAIPATFQPLQIFAYSNDNLKSIKHWINDTVLGRVSDETFVYRYQSDYPEPLLFAYDSDEEFQPFLFEKALLKSFNDSKNNIYLIIEGIDEDTLYKTFGKYAQLLNRANNFLDNYNGYSRTPVEDEALYQYLVKNSKEAKSILSQNEIIIPPNLNIIGAIIMDEKKTDMNFDFEFKRVLIKDDLEINENINNVKLEYETTHESVFPLNRILFGAPGTGKSHKVGKDMVDLLENAEKDYERVTFHPDYTYSQFVGTYKPVPIINKDGKEEISYQYVPGPFIRSYVKALKSAQTDNPKPYLLLIEEINRAKVAAVFGDIFQLLDRKNGVSEYPIRTSEDLRHYLANELKVSEDKVATLTLPDNLYIWATMNSADQGVFPMDTAFKRRWDFEYLELDGGEADIEGYKFNVAGQTYEWNALRKALNEVLSEDYNVNEDKLMGPFFIKLDSYKIEVKSDASNPAESDKKSYEPILSDKFLDVFKNKVLMYLFDDAAKQKRKNFFQGVENSNRYSVICKEFEQSGLQIFDHEVSKKHELFASNDKE